MRSVGISLVVGSTVLSLIAPGITSRSTGVESPRRMSFHNRLLLNRAAVSGLRTIEVMLAVRDHSLETTSALVERLGGRVRRIDDAVGYVRVEVPIEKLLELVVSTDIEAYQISTMSRGTGYRDAQPERNAEMFPGFEVVPPQGSTKAGGTNRDL